MIARSPCLANGCQCRTCQGAVSCLRSGPPVEGIRVRVVNLTLKNFGQPTQAVIEAKLGTQLTKSTMPGHEEGGETMSTITTKDDTQIYQ
jgi:hypothetical protein